MLNPESSGNIEFEKKQNELANIVYPDEMAHLI